MTSKHSHFDVEQPAYKRFRDIFSERTRGVVAWLGAGCSAGAGMPTWPQLRGLLEEELEAKAKTFAPPDDQKLRRSLEGIRNIPNHWTAFDQLKESLGSATYESVIRPSLTPSPRLDTPRVYCDLWRLGIKGILNLNLDRLATRGYSCPAGKAVVNEMCGREMGPRQHVLKSEAPFLVNLHGIAEDATTWVLTAKDLKWLQADEGYRSFINAVLATYTVVFIGISADDSAAGGLVGDLRNERHSNR